MLTAITGLSVKGFSATLAIGSVVLGSFGFRNDDLVQYEPNGATAITGLTADGFYKVPYKAANTFKLKAHDGTSALAISAVAVGHSFR